MDKTSIKSAVDLAFDEIVAIRRDLHMHPELSEQEARTEDVICAYLDKIGVDYRRGISGHGVIATVGPKDAKCAVGIRGDIDALPVEELTGLPFASVNPGVMHACGHDMHTAMQLGVAKVLKGFESELKGAVKLFFQPAEETVGGANGMIAEGAMVDPPVTRVIGTHVDPRDEVGQINLSIEKMNASTTEFTVNVRGISCHGAHPDQGIDAVVVAAHVVLALQTISSRFAAPTRPVIVTIGTIHGGTKENIVAGEVQLHGTIRALDLDTREFIKSHVDSISKGTAAAFGGSAEVTFIDGYPPLVNNRASSLALIDIATEELGSANVHIIDEPSLGADDFAYFSNAAPGVYFNIGCHTNGGYEPQSLHNGHMVAHEEALRVGMLLEILTALRFIDEDLEKIK